MDPNEIKEFIEAQCQRQWDECQAKELGPWDSQPRQVQDEFYESMKNHLEETGQLEEFYQD